VGAGLYLTVIGLFALGLGAIVRNTAGGISLFAGLMFVLPPLMNVLPTSWNNAASPYLPLQAGERVLQLQGGTLSPWEGFAVLCGYALAAIAIAAVLLRSRDV
jgi:ABC-type transport system involved in multi-copper enzyme maturation permease subunit